MMIHRIGFVMPIAGLIGVMAADAWPQEAGSWPQDQGNGLPTNVKIAYTECEIKVQGFRIIYARAHRPAGWPDRPEYCWMETGRIDQYTVEYYRMIGVEMDVVEWARFLGIKSQILDGRS